MPSIAAALPVPFPIPTSSNGGLTFRWAASADTLRTGTAGAGAWEGNSANEPISSPLAPFSMETSSIGALTFRSGATDGRNEAAGTAGNSVPALIPSTPAPVCIPTSCMEALTFPQPGNRRSTRTYRSWRGSEEKLSNPRRTEAARPPRRRSSGQPSDPAPPLH
jgi:hypothetical protein